MHAKEDGSIPATFQIIYMVGLIFCEQRVKRIDSSQIGWKPAPNQLKPLERGTGELNLKDVL